MTTWNSFIQEENKKPYFLELKKKLSIAYKQSTVFPSKKETLKAFQLTPFNDVKVVILGQDPYFNEGQANGLAFSVNDGVPIPPSLQNIFHEIEMSLNCKTLESGNLERWAKQGVLLLNSVLTVEKNHAGSHANLGWQQFTDNAIKKLSDERDGIIFLLWGNYAREKLDLIDNKKHYTLVTSHPSPLSVNKGFSGCKHFHTVNMYLELIYGEDIDWR
jgi:uracil-DNA glycosylase